MLEKEVFRPFVFDSPIDFVLIGLVRGKEQVLIKSRDLSLDLLGWYQNFKNADNQRFFEKYSSFLLPAGTYNQHVDIDWRGNLNTDEFIEEKRIYSIVLLWKGKGQMSYRANDAIKKEIARRIPDIMLALQNKDRSLIEWNVAPIINLCNHFSEINVRRQNSKLIFMGLYILIIVVLLLVFGDRIAYFLSR